MWNRGSALVRFARLPGLEDYFRIARQPGAIAITSYNPETCQELTAMVQFKDVLTALAARESENAINANRKACST